MPEALRMIDVPQPVLSQDQAYKEVSGREIFDELSITGLNRSPIETLTAFITAESELDKEGASLWPEIPLAEICEHILVDGSFVIRYIGETDDLKQDDEYIFLKDCISIHTREVVQSLRNQHGAITNITRVYTRGETEWTMQDIKGYGGNSPQVVDEKTFPVEMLIPYPYGKGLLYQNQKTYRRLEEIEESIRAQTGPAALALIVTGYAGDWKRAVDTFAKGAKVIGIPGSATVTRVASNNTADQLMKDGEGLNEQYKHNMHLVNVSETSTMSGVARIITMMPMLNYVNTIRTVMDEIYTMLGYTISWGGLEILDTAELTGRLDFFKRGRDEGLVSADEYRRKARALYDLADEEIPINDTGVTNDG